MDNVLDLAGQDYDLTNNYDFRHIKIVREFDDELPLVPWTETEIEQVFLNLLTNASQTMVDEIQKDQLRMILRLKNDRDTIRIEIKTTDPAWMIQLEIEFLNLFIPPSRSVKVADSVSQFHTWLLPTIIMVP